MEKLVLSLFAGIAAALLFGAFVTLLKRKVSALPRSNGQAPHEVTSLCFFIFLTAVSGSVVGGYYLGRPIIGLVGAGMASFFGLRAYSVWRIGRRRFHIEVAALGFLRALHGLLRAGVGLSSALFQLAEAKDMGWDAFSPLFEASLRRFQSGKSLSACLLRVRERVPGRALRLGIGLMEMAYRKGLPLLPVLERTLSWLEKDLSLQSRVKDLANVAWAQLAVAAALPWLVFLALSLFEPDLWQRFRESPQFWPLIFFALITEFAGAISVRRAACFY